MRRFFIPPQELKPEVILRDEEFHHLRNVCRLEVGEFVELLDGQGHLARAEIKTITKKMALLAVESIAKMPPPPKPYCEIILSIPRFQKMELIVQKCVELGAHSITPVVSDRSFVKTLSSDLEKKKERWEKIALEACKQSGRAWPMELKPLSTLNRQLEVSSKGLFLYEGEGQKTIKSFLESLKEPESLRIFIGAEGGFSPQEVQLFEARDLSPVTLGPLVLRVETACITILSVIQYHFGLMC